MALTIFSSFTAISWLLKLKQLVSVSWPTSIMTTVQSTTVPLPKWTTQPTRALPNVTIKLATMGQWKATTIITIATVITQRWPMGSTRPTTLTLALTLQIRATNGNIPRRRWSSRRNSTVVRLNNNRNNHNCSPWTPKNKLEPPDLVRQTCISYRPQLQSQSIIVILFYFYLLLLCRAWKPFHAFYIFVCVCLFYLFFRSDSWKWERENDLHIHADAHIRPH